MSAIDTILVLNAGPLRIRFRLFAVDHDGRLRRVAQGQIDGLGKRPRLRATGPDRETLADRAYPIEAARDVTTAMQVVVDWLWEEQGISPLAVGHRVVHGGPHYDRPALIDHSVVGRLQRYIPLAPLHQPHALAPIRVLLANFPSLPQVACFETAFHRQHGDLADAYAIPLKLHEEGVRRYGFHGLSYESVAKILPSVAPELAKGRVIVAHLGRETSMCALRGGLSVESTMGFSCTDGLPMAAQPGEIDPGVVLYLALIKNMSPTEIQEFLCDQCGLRALSGISDDVRELQASADPRAAFAIAHFVHRIALHAGMLAAALQGVDGFVFTAGIGEHSDLIRAQISEKLGWLGFAVDPVENSRHAPRISRHGSKPIYIVAPEEDRMIAQHTLSLLWADGVSRSK